MPRKSKIALNNNNLHKQAESRRRLGMSLALNNCHYEDFYSIPQEENYEKDEMDQCVTMFGPDRRL